MKRSALVLAIVSAIVLGPAERPAKAGRYGGDVGAQFDNVGTLDFPTSGTPEAQKHFLRAVAILHSFGWKQAIAEFEAAQKIDPDFAMAYWGQTLCYNHPLQAEQDAENPRRVLARLGPTREARVAKAPTDREKGLLDAVEQLWGDGDYRARRLKYMDAMERLHAKYPTDDEIAAFYALSLLSGARALDDNSFRYEVRAGTIALDIFARRPTHPGAVHYIIHAFDDPIHAPLALPAARVFAKIAPAVSHARHMPTHIFIQHGMWDLVTEHNKSAYEAARDLWQPGDSVGDQMHSLDWGQYGRLQIGDYAGAKESIDLIQQVLDKSKAARARTGATLAKARYIVETEHWEVAPVADGAGPETLLAAGMSAARTGDLAAAEQIEAKLTALVEKRAAERPAQGQGPGGRGQGAAGVSQGQGPRVGNLGSASVSQAGAVPAGGGHEEHGAAAASMAGAPEGAKSAAVAQREIAALIRLARGNKDEAVTLLTEATKIEESMRPPNGAADPIKPSHELFGEVLLEIGRPSDAVKPFETSMLRMPNRARTLLGLARAYAKTGDRAKAAEHYRKLADIWKGREALPGLQEARKFLMTNDE